MFWAYFYNELVQNLALLLCALPCWVHWGAQVVPKFVLGAWPWSCASWEVFLAWPNPYRQWLLCWNEGPRTTLWAQVESWPHISSCCWMRHWRLGSLMRFAPFVPSLLKLWFSLIFVRAAGIVCSLLQIDIRSSIIIVWIKWEKGVKGRRAISDSLYQSFV